MTTFLIPLQVIIPLMSAPVCAVLRPGRIAYAIATTATLAAFAIALWLLQHVLEAGPIRYAMGGWLPPIGIEYRVDVLSAFMLTLVSGIGAVALPYAYKSVRAEIDEHKQALFYTVYLLCFTGLLGMIITNDVFNVYVFLEISSLATYTLIGMGQHRKSLMAAYEYLILGTIGATFYLIGVGLLYMMTGTLNFDDLAARLPAVLGTPPVIAGFTFICIGLALKFALFPMHLWLCNAYQHAPSFVSTFLSATATKVSLYVFIRILFMGFGENFAFNVLPLDVILMGLALLAIFAGSITAIFQKDIKRMLAYSSVAQIGYIILAVSLGNEAGVTAGIVHMFNHALIKGGLFLCIGAVAYKFHGTTLEHMRGLGKEMPVTMAAFVICALGLIGVPGTAGFISKWVLITGLVEKGYWPVIILVVISSLLAVIYCWRVIEFAYFKEHPNPSLKSTEAPFAMQCSIWLFALMVIYFGVDTQYSLGVAEKAAGILLGGGR
jgi:multicomponent Na+:H+ antiporter subunit D